jgi:rod shape-determining protein MreC
MKTFLNKKTMTIAVVAVLIAIIAIVSVNVFSSDGPVTGLANAVSKPFKDLALSVARRFEEIYNSIYKYDDLQKRYDQVVKDLNDLQLANTESDELLRENISLRAILDFSERHAGHIYEQAAVINLSSTNWSSSFTISVGYANSEKPIARGNSVITENGILIGQVAEVGATTSTVISILDTTFSAAAYVGDGGGRATAKGDFSLMSSGLLRLDYFDEDLILLPDDPVVTSGFGHVFPVGLVIGKVDEVFMHENGIGRYATVRPMRDIDNSIENVYVITSFDITG